MSLLTLLIVLLVVAVLVGGYGTYRGRGPDATGWGWYGWSPTGLIVIILLVYLLVGGRF